VQAAENRSGPTTNRGAENEHWQCQWHPKQTVKTIPKYVLTAIRPRRVVHFLKPNTPKNELIHVDNWFFPGGQK
jgi:hypothetical protein